MAKATTHRASAQRRRDRLLTAAAELASEVGAGAVTHRAVAARAGVPLSTTSYFFSSIDELVTEALRVGAGARTADFDAAEAVAVLGGQAPVDEVLDQVVDRAVASSPTAAGNQVELYLAAGRRTGQQAELHDEVSDGVTHVAGRIERHLDRAGASGAEDAAWAIAALGDGTMLHRLAGVDTDHRARLRGGLRLLTAAAMLDDDEVDELLARYRPEPPPAEADVPA